jgi:cytochrome c-type biogenesis protein CcmH/NrfF
VYKRSVQIMVLLIAAFSMLGAGDPSTRFDKIGHKLMCTCGCSEILLECNHVGCPNSTGLIQDLHAQVDSGASESAILTWFADKNGPIVLAAPLRGNFFDQTTWYIPGLVLVLGIVGILLLVRYWKSRLAIAAAAAPPQPRPTAAEDALRDRIRRDTEY